MSAHSKFGKEFLANTTIDGTQSEPSVTGLADGRFVVSWTNGTPSPGDPSFSAIRAQVFNADGSKQGAEFLVNTTTVSSQFTSAITALTDGRFAVSWNDLSASADDPLFSAIRGQIFNSDGSTSGGEFLVNTTITGNQFAPAITGLANGRFVVSWEDYSQTGGDSSGGATRAQVFNADGSKAGGEFLVNTITTQSQTRPAITALADGRFVVSWQDNSQAVFGNPDIEVRAQIFNADGSRSGGEFLVNSITAEGQTSPAITALADGRFVVSWNDLSASSGDLSSSAIRAQIFNTNGSKAGGEFLVNTTTTGNQIAPSVTGLADGRFVVSWTDSSATGGDISGSAIRAQMFKADGSKAGAEFLVNTTTSSLQVSVSITGLADGRFVVNWQDFSQTGGDTSDSAIRGQIFDPRETAVTLNGLGRDDDLIGTKFGDTMSGKLGNDVLSGGGGRDTLVGNKGNDRLMGDAGRDKLSGGDGRDKLFGGKGNDRLSGNDSKDKLFGGAGRDKITGGAGQDVATGGSGADTFIFKSTAETGKTASTRDLVTDFSQAEGDRIDLSRIDAKSGPADQDFTFIGDAGFTSTKGELRFVQTASKTLVQGDTDGDGVKDFEIALNGVITLTASDFIL